MSNENKQANRTQKIVNDLVSLRALLQGVESVLIDLLAIFTPWLAPIIPASMTYHNMVNRLGFDPLVALIGAAAVEFLGLSAINTAVEFWQYNEDKSAKRDARLSAMSDDKRAKAEKRKQSGAPIWLAIITGGFYVAIVVTVNAIIEIGTVPPVHIAAKILLSLLSVVAGVIIAMRASHARRLSPVKATRGDSSETGATGDATPATNATSGATVTRQPATREEFVTAWSSNGHHSVAELAQMLNVNPRTAQRWVKSASEITESQD